MAESKLVRRFVQSAVVALVGTGFVATIVSNNKKPEKDKTFYHVNVSSKEEMGYIDSGNKSFHVTPETYENVNVGDIYTVIVPAAGILPDGEPGYSDFIPEKPKPNRKPAAPAGSTL